MRKQIARVWKVVISTIIIYPMKRVQYILTSLKKDTRKIRYVSEIFVKRTIFLGLPIYICTLA